MTDIKYDHETPNLILALGISEKEYDELTMPLDSLLNSSEETSTSKDLENGIAAAEIMLDRNLTQAELVAMGLYLGRHITKSNVHDAMHKAVCETLNSI